MMGYIKSKNGNTIVVSDTGEIITGSAQDLSSHPAVISGHYEVVDSAPPSVVLDRIIYVETENA